MTGARTCPRCGTVAEYQNCAGFRRVAVAQHRNEAHAKGRANALRWPYPQDVPEEAIGYPPKAPAPWGGK